MIEKFLSLFTDRVITVSGRGMEDLLRYRIAKKEKVIQIPLGLELEKFLDCEKYRGEFRREFGFQAGTILIGIVARLVPIKGHIYFLEAAKKVLEKEPGARFLIIGDGELRKELEDYALKLGIADRVFWTGFRSDLPRIYADLDIAVLSSLNEGLPVAVIEAMASAKPVVAADVGGVGELVLNGETGIIVPPRDSDALAGGIVDILSNSDKIKEMGRKARERAYPKYSIKRLIGDIENLYDQLIKEKNILE
jgi:glycosyltransferase involved in cell wall biosynthesis